MGRIVVTEFVSLDGVMEDPGGAEEYAHGGWTFRFQDDEGMRYKLEETLNSTALLLGRVTYEGFAKAWPGMTDDVGFAERMNGMPKYVVGGAALGGGAGDGEGDGGGGLAWNNSQRLAGPVEESVPRLRDSLEGDVVVHGSRTLVQSLLALGLVDELRLMIFPVVLGSGKRLFGEMAEPLTLSRFHCQTLDSGSVILGYRR